MPGYLADTNILLRWIQRSSPQRPAVRRALRKLHSAGNRLHLAPQNQFEFWSVATRPVARGGLALSPLEADRKLRHYQRVFIMLPESPLILPLWRSLVIAHAVTDARAHDARLVAAMQAFGLTHILTFNTADFVGYPGIVCSCCHQP